MCIKGLKESVFCRVTRMRLHVLALVAMVLLGGVLRSQEANRDVDSLGNVWAVTMDRTYSMLSEIRVVNGVKKQNYLGPNVIAKRTYDRIVASDFMKQVDWEHDRFLFFTSSIREYTNKYIKSQANLDSSFIHFTDKKFHKFANSRAFAEYVASCMDVSEDHYKNYCSFVSLMRSMTLKKVIEWLEAEGQTGNYHNIRIMTVSDDAVDQHDQWSTDYRALREADQRKVDYIIKHSMRLLFNFSGYGGGDLTLVWNDDSVVPHIWVYEYETTQGRRQADSAGHFFMVKAGDGQQVSVELDREGVAESQQVSLPTLCRIDSMCINGEMYDVGSYFYGEWSDSLMYRNHFPANDVTLYGRIQLAYKDTILGVHQRTVDFVQQYRIPTAAALTLSRILIVLVAIALAVVLLVLLVLLPKARLFTLYDTAGVGRTQVRRGYRWHWKSDPVPLMSIVNVDGRMRVLTKSDSKVLRAAKEKSSASGTNALLLVAKRKLSLSTEDLSYNTLHDDIDEVWRNDIAYPPLLRAVYEQSMERKLYLKEYESNVVGKVLWRVVHLIYHVVAGPTYYHYIKEAPATLLVTSNLLPNQEFLIESQTGKCTAAGIEQVLLYWYDSKKRRDGRIRKDNNLLLTCAEQGENRIWDFYQLEQSVDARVSLRNVHRVFHYEIPVSKSDKEMEAKWLMSEIRNAYGKKANFLNVRLSVLQTPGKGNALFHITESYCLNYLSLVSSKEQAVTQIYSPFTQGSKRTVRFRLAEHRLNYLYSSMLPLKAVLNKNSSYCKQLSNEYVREVSTTRSVSLEIRDSRSCYINGQLLVFGK